MKPTFARAIGALAAVTALVVAGWPPWPLHAQANAPVISTQVLSTTASSGTSSVLALDGKYPNCAIYAQTSTSTATLQAQGNTLTANYGPGAPSTALGSAITATTTQSVTGINTATAPVGLYFTWSGNSGTLTAWATCSSSSSTVFSGTVTANVPTPLPVTQASVPWSVSCLAAYPCGMPTPQPFVTSAATTQSVALCDGTTATTCTKVTNAAGGNQSAAFAPFTQAFNYYWNGTSWTAIGASSPMPVITAAPAPTVSPGNAPAGAVCSGVGCLPPGGTTTVSQAVTTSLTQLIAAPGAGSIHITALQGFANDSATGGFLELFTGTGSNCGTGTSLFAILSATGSTGAALVPGIAWGTGVGNIAIVPAITALCVQVVGGSVNVAQILVTYTVY